MLRIQHGGQEHNAREESFQVIREEWNEYAVSEGTRVKVKVSVQKIFTFLDDSGNPVLDADGDPTNFIRYVVQVVSSGVK